jgi:hypothetical protein
MWFKRRVYHEKAATTPANAFSEMQCKSLSLLYLILILVPIPINGWGFALTRRGRGDLYFGEHGFQVFFFCSLFSANIICKPIPPYSFGLSATSQQYFSLRTNQHQP